jgi:glycosyltransferase involved in cell wall biosynthesis
VKVGLLVPGGVDRSGRERVIPTLLYLIERLARLVELHIFALRQEPRPSRYPLLGATVHNIGAHPQAARALFALMREHRKAAFDVLHAVWAVPQGVIGALAAHALDLPLVLDVIGADLASVPDLKYGALRTRRGRALLRFAAKRADAVTVQSEDMVRRAAALGIRAIRLPLGIDLQRWPPVPARGVSSEWRLLQVGGINRVKDNRTMLAAMQLLKTRGLKCRLDIVGVDTLNGTVQASARALGLADEVTFHGFVPHPELRAFYLRADALIVSSRHESGPVAALEAAVSGVAVIGSQLGFLSDWAPAGAIAVPPRQPELLAQAISELLTDPERARRIADNAQHRAIAEDADWSAERVGELYRSLAGKGK